MAADAVPATAGASADLRPGDYLGPRRRVSGRPAHRQDRPGAAPRSGPVSGSAGGAGGAPRPPGAAVRAKDRSSMSIANIPRFGSLAPVRQRRSPARDFVVVGVALLLATLLQTSAAAFLPPTWARPDLVLM